MHNGAYIGLNDRQQQILDRITREGEVRIAELKEAFPVTEMTIRRDLEKLEETGTIKRTFGGAVYLGKDIALQERSGMRTEEKARIGRKAAALIGRGESVFIDGGTTTLQVARHIPPDRNITVVTNALNVATELAGKNIETHLIGGMLIEATNSLVGPMAVSNVSGMAFDRIFLGATGIDVEHGFSNSNMYEAEIKRMAIRQAAETNVVLDHSKFGAKVLVSFAPLAGVHRIVTDRLPDAALQEACREAGMKLETADQTEQ